MKILAFTSCGKFNMDYFGKKIKEIGSVVRSESCKYVFEFFVYQNVTKDHYFSGKA